MGVYSCKKCGELNYLTPHTGNISDFGAKCEKCGTTNTVTLETGTFDYISSLPPKEVHSLFPEEFD
jgi:hypothetical protein